MVDFSTTLLHGLYICLPFTIFAVGSFWLKPRLWLHSLPPDIIQRAKPKTEREIRLTQYVLLPAFLLILPGLTIASVLYIAETTHTDLSFIGLVIHIYTIWIMVHVWDFLIIDCLHILLINSARPPISGTEGAKGWKDYDFHFRALLRATLMSAIFVLPSAAILYLIYR